MFCTSLDRYGSQLQGDVLAAVEKGIGFIVGSVGRWSLPWDSFTIVTDQIGVACSTISRLWWQARGAPEQSLIITREISLWNKSHANCRKYSHAEFRQGLKEIPRCRRKTYRSTVKAMGVALSTVQRMLLHRDVCRVHTSSLKPTLTEENKMSRMELSLSFMDKDNPSKFENMEDLIHIDEKWFYLTKDGQRFIIAVDEEEPYRHVQHKPFLTKIMFLCAVARPRYDTRRNAWFDRKIGIWPSVVVCSILYFVLLFLVLWFCCCFVSLCFGTQSLPRQYLVPQNTDFSW